MLSKRKTYCLSSAVIYASCSVCIKGFPKNLKYDIRIEGIWECYQHGNSYNRYLRTGSSFKPSLSSYYFPPQEHTMGFSWAIILIKLCNWEIGLTSQLLHFFLLINKGCKIQRGLELDSGGTEKACLACLDSQLSTLWSWSSALYFSTYPLCSGWSGFLIEEMCLFLIVC